MHERHADAHRRRLVLSARMPTLYNPRMAESSGGKSWQARISEATDAIAQEFVESISYDWRLYKVDVAGSIAHATMLAKVGLITDSDRDAIVAGLKEIESEIDRDGPKWAGSSPIRIATRS
jgi:argininosuccinate lyase